MDFVEISKMIIITLMLLSCSILASTVAILTGLYALYCVYIEKPVHLYVKLSIGSSICILVTTVMILMFS